jgi:lipoprotein-anchoring transpeptidase ErfK/SrfK
MAARLVKNGLPVGAKLFGASVSALLLMFGNATIASASPQLKTYPIVAANSETAIELPPLGTPSEYLPQEEVVPEVVPQTSPEVAPVNPTQEQLQARLVLKLGERRVYLYEGNKVKASYPVAIGKPGWETPMGNFSVVDMALNPVWENPWTGEITHPGPDSPIGPAIIVFINNDTGMYAFHGTPNEELIGQAVSHGCVRLRNEDIMALYQTVDLHTPVEVLP